MSDRPRRFHPAYHPPLVSTPATPPLFAEGQLVRNVCRKSPNYQKVYRVRSSAWSEDLREHRYILGPFGIPGQKVRLRETELVAV